MDRYQRVEKPKSETTPIKENEIRITTQGRMRNYITYAITLLQEKDFNEIVLKAMGRAINKTVTIAELIKRRIIGLHQITSTGSTDITDTWEPIEEGLLPLETTRHVSMITITLAKKELNTFSTGYQPPLPADQVRPLHEFDDEEGSPIQGGGRGGRGGRGTHVRGRGRGRGIGRGRGRGRGRGYYNGAGEHNGDGWIGGHGSGGGVRGQARGHVVHIRGRGYSGEAGRGRGRVSGRGRGQYSRFDGPIQAAAA